MKSSKTASFTKIKSKFTNNCSKESKSLVHLQSRMIIRTGTIMRELIQCQKYF